MDSQPDAERTQAEPQFSECHRQQVAMLANATCERVNSRLSLFVAKDLIARDYCTGVFLNDEERAAFRSACNHLARLFALTE